MSAASPQTNTAGVPVWLNIAPEPVYAVVHEAPEGRRRDSAVLMLPCFGWDEACSYRARRSWAIELAEAGYTVVRFDLPGTEDSAGDSLAPARLDAWLSATRQLSQWLRESSGSTRLTALGIGLGGLLAVAATASGAEIDDLILWATPRRGSNYIRELKVVAQVMSDVLPEDDADLEDVTGFGGYPMSSETIAALSKLDLTATAIPAGDHHVLMFGRGAHGIDRRLQEHLEQQVSSLTCAAGDEYEQMMTFPDLSRPPAEAIRRSISWLDRRSTNHPSGRSPLESELVASSTLVDVDGESISERHVEWMSPVGRLVGILSEPIDTDPAAVCVVSVNAGALRRTSPGRVWTDLCRRSAARGIPSLRFDLEGIGDSEGVFIGREQRTADDERRIVGSQLAFHDLLEREGVANRFVATGLCLGAYWEIHASQQDARICGAALINPLAFRITPEQMKDRARHYALAPVQQDLAGRLRELRLPSRAGLRNAASALLLTARGGTTAADESQRGPITDALDALRRRGAEVRMVFARHEPVLEQLERLGILAALPARWPNASVEVLSTTDHNLGPLSSQRQVHAIIDELLDQLVAADQLTGTAAHA